MTGWELGYKGSLSSKAYVTVDGYINELKDFVTDLLPGVNPAFPSFALDAQVNVPAELAALDQRIQASQSQGALTAQQAAQLRGADSAAAGRLRAARRRAPRIQGANALATLPDGSRAVVLSYTNAGEVTERGIEVGRRLPAHARDPGGRLVHRLRLHGEVPGSGRPARAQHAEQEGHVSLSYAGQQGIDANVTVRLVDGYQWSAGVFQGYVPSNEFVNVSAGYRVNNYVRVHATATNLFDQKRFQLYGGIGDRAAGARRDHGDVLESSRARPPRAGRAGVREGASVRLEVPARCRPSKRTAATAADPGPARSRPRCRPYSFSSPSPPMFGFHGNSSYCATPVPGVRILVPDPVQRRHAPVVRHPEQQHAAGARARAGRTRAASRAP